MSNYDFPPELTRKPRALVGFIGLDISANYIHKSIWDLFARQDRRDNLLNYKIFSKDHEFSKSKQKRVSYEWYMPKGLLKSNWIKKHLEDIPSVISIFFELDWDDNLFTSKAKECAHLVKYVRARIQQRNTRIALVLLQKQAPLPMGDNISAAERANQLCVECNIQTNRQLFVLATSESLVGYVSKLESVFQNMSKEYYIMENRDVKSHKEMLNKTIHQLLFVRHEFKIGFFYELQQDSDNALNHYKNAYTHILELRQIDTHIMEIKTVAGYVNYKICQLLFPKKPPETINLFQRHTDYFKKWQGNPELLFEHEAWMSKQFEMLGDLFREVIRQSRMKPLVTQHPGLYYYEAALHAIARRRILQPHASLIHFSSLLSDSLFSFVPLSVAKQQYYNHHHHQHHSSMPPASLLSGATLSPSHSLVASPASSSSITAAATPAAAVGSPSQPAPPHQHPSSDSAPPGSSSNSSPLKSAALFSVPPAELDFYGQRSWRQNKQSIEPPDAQREREAIQHLRQQEKQVEHSKIIISLLRNAIEHFQRCKANRMRLMPIVLMGEEHMRLHEYDLAIKCFEKTLPVYRREHWATLLTSVLINCLKCAYFTCNLQQFVAASLELISKFSQLQVAEKQHIQTSLFAFIRNREVPQFGSECAFNLFRYFGVETDLQSHIQSHRQEVEDLWRDKFGSTDTHSHTETENCCELDVTELCSSIECKVRFSEEVYSADHQIQILVFFKSNAPLPIQLDVIAITLSNPAYSQSLIKQSRSDSAASDAIELHPDQISTHSLFATPLQEDVYKALKVDSVRVRLRGPTSDLQLLWNFAKPELHNSTISSVSNSSSFCESTSWNNIWNRAHTKIQSRQSQLEIQLEHAPPAMLNEFYPITVHIINKELQPIKHAEMSIDVEFVPIVEDGSDLSAPPTSSTSTVAPPPSNPDSATAGLANQNSMPANQQQQQQMGICVAIAQRSQPNQNMIDSPKNGHQFEEEWSEPALHLDKIQLDSIETDQKFSKHIRLKCASLENVKLSIRVSYEIRVRPDWLSSNDGSDDDAISCLCNKLEHAIIPMIRPFHVSSQLFTTLMKPISHIITEQPCILQLTVSNVSNCPIQIIAAQLIRMQSHLRILQPPDESHFSKIVFKSQEALSLCFLVQLDDPFDQLAEPINTGTLQVNWQRCVSSLPTPFSNNSSSHTSSSSSVVCTECALPGVSVSRLYLAVELEAPPIATCQTPFLLRYRIRNNSRVHLQLRGQLEPSDAFLFSGQQSAAFCLEPRGATSLPFRLLPLQSGPQPLPRFLVKLVANDNGTSASNMSTSGGIATNAGGAAAAGGGGAQKPASGHVSSYVSAAYSQSDCEEESRILMLLANQLDRILSDLPSHLWVKPLVKCE